MARDAVRAIGANARARERFARTSEPPCFSVIPMPMRPPRLCSMGMSRGSYSRVRSRGTQFPCQPRVPAHGRNRAVRHGGGAERAALHLRLHQVARGSRHVRAGDRAAVHLNPGSGVIAPRGNASHQGMPGGMKFYGIDALAPHVEGMQYGRVAVGEARILEGRRRAEGGPGTQQVRDGRAGALAAYRLLQREVGGEEVVVRQRGRLIENRMGDRSMFHGRPIRSVRVRRTALRSEPSAIAPNMAPMLDSSRNVRFRRQAIQNLPQLRAAGFACPAAAPLGATYTRYRSALTRPEKS